MTTATLSSTELAQLKHVRLVRESIRTVAKLLTGKNVSVIQSGSIPHVRFSERTGEVEAICIPYIPDDASDEFLDCVQGFIDHECFHVLFTEVSTLEDARIHRVPQLHNMFEDIYIERMGQRLFPGSIINLRAARQHIIDMVEGAIAEQTPTTEWEWWCKLCVVALRKWAGHYEMDRLYSEYSANMPSIIKDFEEANIADIIEGMSSSDDAMAAALIAKGVLRKYQPPSEPSDGETEAGDGDGGKPCEEGESSESTESDEGGGDPDGDADDSTGDDSDSRDTIDSNKNDSEGDNPDIEQQETGDGEDSEEDEDAPTEDHKRESDLKELTDEPESEEEEDDWVEPDMISMEEALSKKIQHGLRDIDESTSFYRPWTDEHDEIGEFDPGSIPAHELETITESVGQTVGSLQSQLEGLLISLRREHRRSGTRKGRLHARNLYRLQQDDDRVFSQKVDREVKDAAVSLAVDLSGSMSGTKMWCAALSAWALGETLARLDIPTEIIGFSTKSFPYSEMTDEVYAFHGRREALFLPIFKQFEQPFGQVEKARLAKASRSRVGMEQNVDGESVRVIADRLLLRDEDRKIMIVLSDGSPAASVRGNALSAHLKRVAKEVEAEGVELMGIGIASNAVTNFYTNNAVIHSPEDLAGVVLGSIKDFLLEGLTN